MTASRNRGGNLLPAKATHTVSLTACMPEHCTEGDEGTHELSKVPSDAGNKHKYTVSAEYVSEHCIQQRTTYFLSIAESDTPKTARKVSTTPCVAEHCIQQLQGTYQLSMPEIDAPQNSPTVSTKPCAVMTAARQREGSMSGRFMAAAQVQQHPPPSLFPCSRPATPVCPPLSPLSFPSSMSLQVEG